LALVLVLASALDMALGLDMARDMALGLDMVLGLEDLVGLVGLVGLMGLVALGPGLGELALDGIHNAHRYQFHSNHHWWCIQRSGLAHNNRRLHKRNIHSSQSH
jgi:hypothetical protein